MVKIQITNNNFWFLNDFEFFWIFFNFFQFLKFFWKFLKFVASIWIWNCSNSLLFVSKMNSVLQCLNFLEFLWISWMTKSKFKKINKNKVPKFVIFSFFAHIYAQTEFFGVRKVRAHANTCTHFACTCLRARAAKLVFKIKNQ